MNFKFIILFIISLMNLYYPLYETVSFTFSFIVALLFILNFTIFKYKYSFIVYTILNLFLYKYLFPANNLLENSYLFFIIELSTVLISLNFYFKFSEKYLLGILLSLLYFDAGLWKLCSPSWLSGNVFIEEYYYNNLITNQYFIHFLMDHKYLSLFVLFYQLFFFSFLFIKNKYLKYSFLFLGIFQHIGIIFIYNLHFFGLFMIALYIPLFKEEKFNKNILYFFIPLFIIIPLIHFYDYLNNIDRTLKQPLIVDIEKEAHNYPFLATINSIYITANVFIPFKHFSNNQIQELDNKIVFSKKYLRATVNGKSISNVPEDSIFFLYPYEALYLSKIFLYHSNFQYIDFPFSNVEEVFIYKENNNFHFETFNHSIDLKFKTFIENSVYSPNYIYSLNLK